MSGVAIIRSKLANSSQLTAIVPSTRIYAGPLSVGTTYPAIAITSISTNQQNNLKMGSATYLAYERVQVTVYAGTYPLQRSLMSLVRAACPNTRATVNGFVCDAILPYGDGPDLFDDVIVIYEQSQDFMVRYLR